jgi:hypothetical protein
MSGIKLMTSWTCLGPSTIPLTSCDATGDTDRGAEKHCRETGHSTITSMKEAPK